MNPEPSGARARLALAAASVTVAAVVMAVVIAGVLLPEGDAVDVEEGDAITFSVRNVDGQYMVVVEGSVVVTSHMNETIDGISLDVSVRSADGSRSVTLYSDSSLSLPAGGRAEIPLDAEIDLASMYFVVEEFIDSAVDDMAPMVTLTVDARADYMLGPMSVELSGDLVVSLAEPGGSIGFDVTADTREEYEVTVTGLAQWLVPGDMEYVVSCAGASMSFTVSSDEGVLALAVRSEHGIADAIGVLVSPDTTEITVTDGDGVAIDIETWQVQAILAAFGVALDVAGVTS